MVHPRTGFARSRRQVLKYFLLILTLAVTAIALLTVLRAPDWIIAWKLAILAGEYGQWLVFLPVGLALVAGYGTAGSWRGVTLLLCGVAAAGLLRPAVTAWRMAPLLPGGLRAAFGARDQAGPVFDWVRLYGGSPRVKAAMTTEVFARPDGQELKVDFYRPAMEKDMLGKPRPCVIVIHGGGWDGGDRKQLPGWNDWLVARGYNVAAISYRLAPKWQWPAQGEDVLTAIAWLKAHATALGINPTRLVLMGRSAGGQIASAVGYEAHDPAIRGVIALYAPHDMPFVWSVSRSNDVLNSLNLMQQYMGGPPEGARLAPYASASAQTLARADSPPTLLVHGAPDTLSWARHSERLAARLAELKVPHYYLRLPWATHAFDFNPDGPGSQLTGYAMKWFLAAVTK
jgi:acetyl esterase/lipase